MASNAPNMESATQQTSNGTGGPDRQMSMTPTDGSEPATQPSSKKSGGSESGGPKRRAKAREACPSTASKGTTKPKKLAACADAMEASETKRARRVKKKATNESAERGGSQKPKRKKKADEAGPKASAETSKTR